MACCKEDMELMNRLRNKYISHNTDASGFHDTDHDTSGVPDVKGFDSLAHVHLCPVCQGSGIKEEIYEFRRLQSNCSHCQGEGIFTTGKASTAANNSTNKASSHPYRANDAASADKDAQEGALASKNERQLQRQLDKLQQKLAALAQERDDLLASLSAPDSSCEKRQLQQQLVDQLQQHMHHLQDLQQQKQAALKQA